MWVVHQDENDYNKRRKQKLLAFGVFFSRLLEKKKKRKSHGHVQYAVLAKSLTTH